MSTTVIPATKHAAVAQAAAPATSTAWVYFLLFFVSGIPALLYQIVWQRALFTLFGANIESVTIIVTVFMLGLGLGSLAGGKVSAFPRIRLLAAFGIVELCTGTFGAASLWIFHRVAAHTAGSTLLTTGIAAFALLLVPTLLMGSTLPLLSEHFVRRTGNVGESVGLLYSVNTFGSALACLASAAYVMRMFGESGSVRLAVVCNLFVGTVALLLEQRNSAESSLAEPPATLSHEILPLPLGMFLAGAAGFVALAYEIVWYRIYSFATGTRASAFPLLLWMYLLGIAYGSLKVRGACRRKVNADPRRMLAICAEVILVGSLVAFLAGPALAECLVHFSMTPLLLVLVLIAASLLGAAFPLLSHIAIDPGDKAGKGVSLLYLSNILGSTAGSFVIGFIAFDHYSTRAISLLLLILGLILAIVLARLSGPQARRPFLAAGLLAALALILAAGPLFSSLYEKLLFKGEYRPGMRFSSLVENRSGVLAVYTGHDQTGDIASTVYGGGAYDGRFNTDLSRDSNGIFRMYAVAGMHPAPKHILMVGLGSGSWAQIAANLPLLDDLTIVEIDPGYVSLIRREPVVQSLLQNPKVHIVIDDGRRWLVANSGRRFDMVVINTTFHWRANSTNLLSAEFLQMVRPHLLPGGILYYNTTWSPRALATAIAEYPYALRVANFIAVSDSPFGLDKNRWRAALLGLRIDGKPAIDPAIPAQQAALTHLLQMADQTDTPDAQTESRDSLAKRLQGVRPITDDNMGHEWD